MFKNIKIKKRKLKSNNIKKTQSIEIKNQEGLEYLKTISDNSIDLILTDPPYIISKETGMSKHLKVVEKVKHTGDYINTEDDWIKYSKTLKKPEDEIDAGKGPGWSKENWLKYGSIYGNKYAVETEFGEWDSNFTLETMELFIKEYYKKLRKGGTCIIFFDIWKITILKDLMEKYKFKQIRFIEWIKTNPQPRNSKINYLTNCREIALLGVKGGKPTFNSSYDNGIYKYPFPGGKSRYHPTQKSLDLFKDLIKKHSNENDIVMDTFLGSGTTAKACKDLNRSFRGCEASKEYFDKIKM